MQSLNNLISYFSLSYESLIVLMITSVTCALIGSFLVLRNLSMVADAISHSVLLGIVLAFFIVADTSSPLLIIGAGLFGVLTVFCIEVIGGTGLVKHDDAVGIIYPLFFALAVILISRYLRNVHIDTDMVLMGEVILAPLNRIEVLGLSLPKAAFEMGILLIVNLLFVKIFFKELKVTTFDKEFAQLAGFSSGLIFYILMTLTSVTSVVAFDAVGAILVVSFLITPGASAYLVTKDLKHMLAISATYAVINSLVGYMLALYFNVSMSGMTATVAGVNFFLTFLFSKEGYITYLVKRNKNKKIFRDKLLLMHIGNHMGEEGQEDELGISTIKNHLMWEEEKISRITNNLIDKGFVRIDKDKNIYLLTSKGQSYYQNLKETWE